MLVGIEHAFWRDQLENLDRITNDPTVRFRARPKLLFGFGEAHVDTDFARRGAREQKLQRDGGFAGAWAALQQVETVTRNAAQEHMIQPVYSGARCRKKLGCDVHGRRSALLIGTTSGESKPGSRVALAGTQEPSKSSSRVGCNKPCP